MPGGMGHHKFKKGMGVKKAFGEPIKVSDRVTIITVAKVMSGGGMGMGEGEKPAEEGEESEARPKEMMGKGGGYGYMGGVKPVGFIKVKGDCVRFVPIRDMEHMAKCMIPVCMFAMLIFKKKMMHKKMMMGGHHGMGPHCGMHHGMHHGPMMMQGHHGGTCPMCGEHHKAMMHHKMMMHKKMHHMGGPC